MSSRFHNKWHRSNHHTTIGTDTTGYPDASHDPIASPEYPFNGVFVINSPSIAVSANGGATFQSLTADSVLSTVVNTTTSYNLYVAANRANIATINALTINSAHYYGDRVDVNSVSALSAIFDTVYVSGYLVANNISFNNSTFNNLTADTLKVNTLDVTNLEIQGYTVSGDLIVSNNVTVGNSISAPSISAGVFYGDGSNLIGVQTPWKQNINGAGYNLSNVSSITATSVSADNITIGDNSLHFYSGATISSDSNSKILLNNYSYAESVQTGTSAYGQYSHAEGYASCANAYASHAEGYQAKACGIYSHAEGISTITFKAGSHAEGVNTQACGDYSHAEGWSAFATCSAAHAEGYASCATSFASHAEGYNNCAAGQGAHAEGWHSCTLGCAAHAEGLNSCAEGAYSHTEGYQTYATHGAHAEGYQTKACGINSHAEGTQTLALNDYTHTEGYGTKACNIIAHAEGYFSCAVGERSHAEGQFTQACGYASHSENECTCAKGQSSHAEGLCTYAGGNYSHTEGAGTSAIGLYSHAEGINTCAVLGASHTEGAGTIALSAAAHAEGYNTLALDFAAHSEGQTTIAYGLAAHAEGNSSCACAQAAHAEGEASKALAQAAHSEGYYTFASGVGSHAQGCYAYACGNASHAEGVSTLTLGTGSRAQGAYSHACADYSQAAGINARAVHYCSYVWSSFNSPVSTQQTGQYVVSAIGGVLLGPTVTAGVFYGDGSKLTGIGSGSQTPWTQNINGGGNGLTNVSSITAVSISAAKLYGDGSGLTGITVGASQTPWTSNINAAGNSLSGVNLLLASSISATSISASNLYGNASNVTGLPFALYAPLSGATFTGAVSTNNNVTANKFIGDGSQLTGVLKSLTPWTQDISGGGYNLFAVGSITADNLKVTNLDVTNIEIQGYTVSGNFVVTNNLTVGNSITAPSISADNIYVGNNSLHFYSGATISSDISSRILLNNYSYAESTQTGTSAIGQYSHAEGQSTTAYGNRTHTEGYLSKACGIGSHAEGISTNAIGNYSHAEGSGTWACGYASHTESYFTSAIGGYSHAEGQATLACGIAAHAEGIGTATLGNASHAEGEYTFAGGVASHAGGYCATVPTGHDYSYIWSSYSNPVSTTDSRQYLVSAENGIVLGSTVTVLGNLTATKLYGDGSGLTGITVGASQTPWTSNINAAGNSLSGVYSISAAYISAQNIKTDNIIATSTDVSVIIINKSSDYTFVDTDNNKIFHFDTSTQTLTAIFSSTLRRDFNCAIMNIGTNSVILSAYAPIKSQTAEISARYGGAFIYKDSSNNIYAVGGGGSNNTSGASQTPWTQNIDGGNNNLSNVNSITSTSLYVNALYSKTPTASAIEIYNNLNMNGYSISGVGLNSLTFNNGISIGADGNGITINGNISASKLYGDGSGLIGIGSSLLSYRENGTFSPPSSATGTNSIAQGTENISSNNYSTVGGGCTNSATGQYSTVAGGRNNLASGWASVIAGGDQNISDDYYTFVGAGQSNHAAGALSFIGAGQYNCTRGVYSFIGAGYGNCINSTANSSSIVGGYNNYIGNDSCYSSIIGRNNTIQPNTLDTHIIGSSITASTSGYTYVNNLSTQGNIHANSIYSGVFNFTGPSVINDPSAVFANLYLTVMINGSALGIPLYSVTGAPSGQGIGYVQVGQYTIP